MSRREKKALRRHAERQAELRRLVEQIEEAGLKIGMSWDEAVQLICDAARELRHVLTTSGSTTQAPWGVTYDPRALEITIDNGFQRFYCATQELKNPRELSHAESRVVYADLLSGAMTFGAAALLYLQSQPLSYELARHVVATEVKGDPESPGPVGGV